jgi:hypothetical protein
MNCFLAPPSLIPLRQRTRFSPELDREVSATWLLASVQLEGHQTEVQLACLPASR